MPKIKNPSPNSIKIIIFVIKISGTMPPTVSRKESITYVNGKYGEIVWKNLGAVTTGNVPPPPAICNTSKMIAIALPGFPSNDTHVYTIVLKTIAHTVRLR